MPTRRNRVASFVFSVALQAAVGRGVPPRRGGVGTRRPTYDGVSGRDAQNVPECGLPQPSSLTRGRIAIAIIANIRRNAVPNRQPYCDIETAAWRMLAMIGSIEKGLILWREAGCGTGEEYARHETMRQERRGRARTQGASVANPRRARFSPGATRRKQGKERGRPRASKGVASDEALRRGLSMNGERALA